jgi:hypothetical protein
VGGAVGRTWGYVSIDGCNSRQGGFTIDKTGSDNGSYYVAGFIGDFFYSGSTNANAGTIKNCYSIGHVTAIAGGLFTGAVAAGGFGGRIAAAVSHCYAQGNVSALGYAGFYASGFAGLFLSGSKAEYCYATGNVSAISQTPSTAPTGSISVYAGGFTGVGYELSNCYATGNVFADSASIGSGSSGDNLYTGGFLGNLNAGTGTSNTMVDRCFAAGSVTAQRSTAGTIHAGGLVGNASSRPVTNSAALGASVTATGGTTRNVGRVYGNGTDTYSNNHANNAMVLTQNATYGAPSGTPVTQTIGHNQKDGADAHDGLFRVGTFWQNDLTFSPTYWSFTTTVGRRHPVLKDEKGAVMGGQ